MSVAHAVPSVTPGSPRWLLLGSLALNLSSSASQLPWRSARRHHPIGTPIFRSRRAAGGNAAADRRRYPARPDQSKSRGHRRYPDKVSRRASTIHDVLRQEPFDVEAMRAATAQTRAAGLAYDQTVQGVFANIAAKISPAPGARRWPIGPRTQARGGQTVVLFPV